MMQALAHRIKYFGPDKGARSQKIKYFEDAWELMVQRAMLAPTDAPRTSDTVAAATARDYIDTYLMYVHATCDFVTYLYCTLTICSLQIRPNQILENVLLATREIHECVRERRETQSRHGRVQDYHQGGGIRGGEDDCAALYHV